MSWLYVDECRPETVPFFTVTVGAPAYERALGGRAEATLAYAAANRTNFMFSDIFERP